MTATSFADLQARAFSRYETLNLAPWLDQLRAPGRYQGLNGLNILTNAERSTSYDPAATIDELRRAAAYAEAPYASSLQNGRQGLSLGLNPYTDWALAQLDTPPERWILVMGLDWYAASKLLPEGLPPERWFDFVANPFIDPDPYWHRLWAWILRRCPPEPPADGKDAWLPWASRDEAAAYIRETRTGFLFHNRIPYLRPADVGSTDGDWPHDEWAKPDVRADILADLRLLWQLTEGRLTAYCTSGDTCDALRAADFPASRVHSLKAHPSYHYRFNPKHFRKLGLWLPGVAS